MSISILPPEILGEIFASACARFGSLSIPFDHHDRHMILTQVSQHWKAVVYSTPSLWTNIYIQFTDPLRLPRLVEDAQQCLLRSGDFPVTLDVFILSPNSTRMTLASMSDEVVQTLIKPNAHRWEKLDLRLAPESFDLLLSLPVGSFSNLKELTIRIVVSTYFEFTPLNALSTGLAQSPLLTHLKLSTTGIGPANAWHLQCPWKQMTNIDLSAFKITDDCCHAILRECHQLEQFLVLTTSPCKSLDISHPIILPHLHSLSVTPITRVIDNDFSTFFTPLVTPNLKYFCFNRYRVAVSLHTIGFRAFQTRSNFQLEYLKLTIANDDRPAFQDILISCPSLLKLHVPDPWFLKGDDSLARGYVIPKLEHIILTSSSAHSAELLEVVNFRMAPGYPFPLKRLEVLTVNDAELRRVFREYISQGLQVGS